jgi:hypothetical protein
MDTLERHEVVNYRGRDVCSCGDFNCASLDVRPLQKKPNMNGHLRNAVANAYRGYAWQVRVSQMSDEQIYVIFQRLKKQNKL